MRPHRQQHQCLGEVNAAFVARMEDVLAGYERPYDAQYPVACFDERLPAKQARALAARFEVHYTPKNASWLNMVEFELPAIARRCLHQRIPTEQELAAHVAACGAERNATRATVKRPFTLEKARGQPDRHYQNIQATNLPN